MSSHVSSAISFCEKIRSPLFSFHVNVIFSSFPIFLDRMSNVLSLFRKSQLLHCRQDCNFLCASTTGNLLFSAQLHMCGGLLMSSHFLLKMLMNLLGPQRLVTESGTGNQSQVLNKLQCNMC